MTGKMIKIKNKQTISNIPIITDLNSDKEYLYDILVFFLFCTELVSEKTC